MTSRDLTTAPGEIKTLEPRWDVVMELADIARVALEKDCPDIARGWTAIAESLCTPVRMLATDGWIDPEEARAKLEASGP